MKKVLTSCITLLLVMVFMVNPDITAKAAVETTTVKSSDLKTVFDVKNNRFDGATCTNIGGIASGTANNRLFVVKSNKYEHKSTLYYYNNVYNNKFFTGDKEPKKIQFAGDLLGHANAMAVDDNYIYVTMWGSNVDEKSAILQISRKAISLLSSGSTVSSTDDTVSDSSGKEYKICTKYSPTYESGVAYTRAISAITRYTYDKTNKITKFIINYSYAEDKSKLVYTIATLKDGKFTVSVSDDDRFFVENPNSGSDIVMQDIFYDYSYGLVIPMWAKTTKNYILFVNIRDLKTQGKTEMLTFEPYKNLYFSKTSDDNGTLTKYEIESVAFIKRDEDKNLTDFRLLFSCNKADADGVGCDSIEEITPLKNYVTKIGT